jgi:histidyl-tRNA synthetase
MSEIIKTARGTKDILPSEVYKWQHIEAVAREICDNFCFKEIRTPTFEDTRLFKRGVGDTTDVVQKEMYTFAAKEDKDSLTLRPEGTASAARSYIENSLNNGNFPIKMYYIIPCFRYEKPQAGRYREFHQFGVEMFGAASYNADVEVISLAAAFFERLGIKNLSLNINSLGCRKCRKAYSKALTDYFAENLSRLCPTCQDRFNKNPMRIIDCKSPICSEIAKNAPSILDFLCDDCNEHFDGVKKGLSDLNIDFKIDPQIVRGLDYYSRTVFEFVSGDLGAQSTVCGGGRYDRLVEDLGGMPTPGLGFALGLERLLLIMEEQGLNPKDKSGADLFIGAMDDEGRSKAMLLALQLRRNNISVSVDLMGRSLKAQMKYADKTGAENVLILGSQELESGIGQIKHMATGEKTEVKLDNIIEFFKGSVE